MSAIFPFQLSPAPPPISPFRKAMGLATAQRIAGDAAGALATLTAYTESRKKPKPPQPATEEPQIGRAHV